MKNKKVDYKELTDKLKELEDFKKIKKFCEEGKILDPKITITDGLGICKMRLNKRILFNIVDNEIKILEKDINKIIKSINKSDKDEK